MSVMGLTGLFVVVALVVNLSVLESLNLFLLGDVVPFVRIFWIFVWTIASRILMQVSSVTVIWSLVRADVFAITFAVLALIASPIGVFHDAHSNVSIVVMIFQQQRLIVRCRKFLECKLVRKSRTEDRGEGKLTRTAIASRNAIAFMIEFHAGTETDNICRKRSA